MVAISKFFLVGMSISLLSMHRVNHGLPCGRKDAGGIGALL